MPAWSRLLVVALAACVCSASAASSQTLGDVAKKEEQRRKQAKPAAKTITNKDLGPGGTRPDTPAPAAAEPAAAGEEATKEAQPARPPDPKQTEAYWRERIEATREEIRRNEMFLEALQSRINALSTDFVNRDDPYQRGAIGADRQKALAEMERVKDALTKLKQEILNIEEEARQAGVPPGWIR